MARESRKSEPERLKAGKAFHKLIQSEWLETAKGAAILPEKHVRRRSGRIGRVDIFVDEVDDQTVAVAEIKHSDWDIMTPKAVRRNALRHIQQIWSYIESQLDNEASVFAGVIFPKRPRESARLELIEELFNEEGIQVVWHDETIEETRARLGHADS